jgi:phosphate transport system protein
MARKNYQERLDQLRADVVAMGDLVLERYETALRAAETGDDDLVDEVVGGDHEVNARYLELEEACTGLLALQQPVAGDLRLVTASFKIITDLERVGDLATNIAEYGGEDGGIHPAVDFRGLGDDAGEMVADALAAYEAVDPDACREIDDRDDDLDERCRQSSKAVVRELLETDRARAAANGTGESDPDQLADTLDEISRALLAIRDLERVGDHGVNIAARTLYMIESDDELIY